jgi:hypothetical protein
MAECLMFGPVDTLTKATPNKRKAVLWTQGNRAE